MKGIINKALFAMLISSVMFSALDAMDAKQTLTQTKEFITNTARDAQNWSNNTALPWIKAQGNSGKEALDKGLELAQYGFKSAKNGLVNIANKTNELVNNQNSLPEFIKQHQIKIGIATAGLLTGIAIESGAARKVANGIKTVGGGVKSAIGKAYNVISNNKALTFGAGMLCAAGICLNKDALSKIVLERDIIHPTSSFVTKYASYIKENSEDILKNVGLFSFAVVSTIALKLADNQRIADNQ